jgi:hypothetical protein
VIVRKARFRGILARAGAAYKAPPHTNAAHAGHTIPIPTHTEVAHTLPEAAHTIPAHTIPAHTDAAHTMPADTMPDHTISAHIFQIKFEYISNRCSKRSQVKFSAGSLTGHVFV